MPQELLIAKSLRVKDLILTFPLNLEAVHNLKSAVLTSLLDVLVDHVVGRMARLQVLDRTLELLEVHIDWIFSQDLTLRILLHLCSLLVHDLIGDLDVKQVGDQVILLLNQLHGVDDEERHLLHAEVVRDIRVKVGAQIYELTSLVLVDCSLDLTEDFVATEHGLLRKLAERHPAHIDIDRDDTGLHHCLIEEELHQILDWHAESALLDIGLDDLSFGCSLHSTGGLVFVVGLVRHLDFRVPLSELSICLLLVSFDCTVVVHADARFHSIDSDPAVARVDRRILAWARVRLGLEYLDDVELVVVSFQVAPVQVDRQRLAFVVNDFKGTASNHV